MGYGEVMAVWKIDLPVTGSISVEVYADSREEAARLLAEGEYEPTTSFCVQCSGYSSVINNFPVQFSLDLDELDRDRLSNIDSYERR